MKSFLLFGMLALQSLAINAQPPAKKDTTLRGGWWTGSGARPQLIAPVLQNPEKKKEIQPKQTICFDKRFFILGEIQEQVINCCFLLNSESGISGSVPLYDADCKCEFDIHKPGFQFLLTTKKGIEFRYFNREEKTGNDQPKQIKHYVITGNTHHEQMDDVADQKILLLKEGSYRECLNGQVKAREYTTGDGKSSLFLAGDNYPKELIIKDHLGAYGLGHIRTTAGHYLVLAHTRGTQFNMAVREIENLGTPAHCFSTAPFSVMESEEIPLAMNDAEERERKLEEKLSRGNSSIYPCASKKAEATAFKLAATKKEKEILGKLQHEKIRATSESDMYKLSAMYNPVTLIAIERRELEHKLCVLENDISNSRLSAKQMERASRQVFCWENKIAVYKRLEDLWNEIESKYKDDPKKLAKARGEFQRDELLPGIKEAQCKP
ncbi:hypothetical protein [Pseudobacter ginsenosidimutans]|uniref:Uncharacterized protein n=1 Tax=Pseudobacter ginsenosidimutans TaxID=661488 RepID=A0A4Q7N3B0_9BACT|nr:hypothetical protein [Pseudobacter ginsenosidimutans]QEC43708.1 hypothetical protein FSB84_19225 [Pseudobacter ginsenosidimutans]RZS75115.1 hypothetical protein EV199_0976 [Pseudobacter ginsenosidimutans]